MLFITALVLLRSENFSIMKAVLLDRDGVINALIHHQDAGIIDAPFRRAQFKLLPRVPAAVRVLNDLGLPVAIVSNQPGIAKGHLKPEMLKAFERTMVLLIGAEGGRIDHIHYCLHHKVWANSGDLLGHSISDPYGSAPSSLASLNIRRTITHYQHAWPPTQADQSQVCDACSALSRKICGTR